MLEAPNRSDRARGRGRCREQLRVYAPNTRLDAQVLIHSRQLVREALKLLRDSDPLVRGLRLREELGKTTAESDGSSP
jgi:hypothetical protein